MTMKKPNYLIWILAVEAVGVLSGFLSRGGTELYNEMIQKPALSPPAILFPIVWTILYALMGIGAARIAAEDSGPVRSRALNVFITQLILNFFWSLIFFELQAFGFALVWLVLLWVLVAWMIFTFLKVDPLAAWLQIPYLLWLTFAAYLTAAVWLLNG